MTKIKYAKINNKYADLVAHRPLDSDQMQLIRDVFGAEQAYASNAIEGSTLTLKETQAYLAFGITAKGKPLRDHLEVSGHESAMNYVYELVGSAPMRTVTEVDIRQLHRLLFEASWQLDHTLKLKVGAYKTENNHVLTRSGRIHYYADVHEVPALMGEFVEFFNGGCQHLHPVEACSLVHHKFTSIHPFTDGNGRIARILSNLYLIQNSWPPFIIRA